MTRDEASSARLGGEMTVDEMTVDEMTRAAEWMMDAAQVCAAQ